MRAVLLLLAGAVFWAHSGAALGAERTPQLVLDPGGHTGPVNQIAFTPDGGRLVSVSDDKTVRIWSIATLRTVRTIYLPAGTGIEGRLNAVAVSPDGGTAAVGGIGYFVGRQSISPVYLIDLKTGALRATLRGTTGPITALSYAKDGKLLGASTTDGEIVLWSTATNRTVLSLATKPHEQTKKRDMVTDLAFSPTDPNVFATVSGDGDLHVFTVNPAKGDWDYLGEALGAHSEAGDTRLAWHPAGDGIVTGGGDECLGLWDLDRRKKMGQQLSRIAKPVTGLGNQPFAIRFRPDGEGVLLTFAFGSTRTRVNPGLWPLGKDTKLIDFPEFPDRKEQIVQVAAAAAVHFSPDKTRRLYALSGYEDHSIRLLVVQDNKVGSKVTPVNKAYTLGGLSAGAWSVGWSRDGSHVGWNRNRYGRSDRVESAFSLSDLELKNAAPPKAVFDFGTRSGPWGDLRRVANRRYQFTPTDGKPVAINPPEATFGLTDAVLVTGAKSPQIVASTESGHAVLYDAFSGDVIRQFWGNLDVTRSVGASRDGKFLVASSGDGTVRVWAFDSVIKDTWSGTGIIPGRPNPAGLTVAGTQPGSGSAAAGLAKGDIVTAVAETGERFSDLSRPGASTELLRGPPGSVVTLKVLKGGKAPAVEVKVTRKRLEQEYPRTEPLLSVFAAPSGEWIAWTPEGYYACSPGGERLMGWRVDGGLDELAEFHPAERFRASLYRPDVILLLAKTGSVAKAVELANKEAKRPEAPAGVIAAKDAIPPRVKVTGPEPGLVGAQVKVTADVEWAPGNKVKEVRVYLDGTLAATEKVFADPKAVREKVSWTIEVPPGEHAIKVVAVAERSDQSADPVRIERAQKAQPAGNRKLFVLSVGVDDLAAPNNGKGFGLAKPERNAADVGDAIGACGAGTYKVEKVVLTGAKATRANVINAISAVQKVIERGDLFVFYFAGHGKVDNGAYYLLTHDANPAQLAATALSADELGGLLSRTQGVRVCFLDTCNAGEFKKLGTQNLTRSISPTGSGVYLCGSSGAGEKAHDGLFAQHLTQELLAKPQAGMRIQLEEVHVLTKKRVVTESEMKLRQKQTPWLHTPDGRDADPAEVFFRK